MKPAYYQKHERKRRKNLGGYSRGDPQENDTRKLPKYPGNIREGEITNTNVGGALKATLTLGFGARAPHGPAQETRRKRTGNVVEGCDIGLTGAIQGQNRILRP